MTSNQRLAVAFDKLAQACAEVSAALAVASAEPVPVKEVAPPAPAPASGPIPVATRKYLPKWATPSRIAILQETWPSLTPRREIIARLQLAGGPDLSSDEAVGIFAVQGLGLRRPDGFTGRASDKPEPIISAPPTPIRPPSPAVSSGPPALPSPPETTLGQALHRAIEDKIAAASAGETMWLSWPEIKQVAARDGKILTDMHELQGYNRWREERKRAPIFIRKYAGGIAHHA